MSAAAWPLASGASSAQQIESFFDDSSNHSEKHQPEAGSVKTTMDLIVAFAALFVFFTGLWWLVSIVRKSNKTYSEETLPIDRKSVV